MTTPEKEEEKIVLTTHHKAKGWIIANLIARGHTIKRVERTGAIIADSPSGEPPDGEEFYVIVHSLKDNNAWVCEKEGGEPVNLFHAFVRVPNSLKNETEEHFRVFLMHTQEVNDELDKWVQTHAPPPPSGFGWNVPHPFENCWEILPK